MSTDSVVVVVGKNS